MTETVSAPAFLPGSEYLSLPRDPQPWVIKDLIPVGGLTNLYGKPKSGKSFAALGMAMAVANGEQEWLGFDVRKHGPVAYLQIDTPRSHWSERLIDIQSAGHNINGIQFCDMLMSPYPYNVLDASHQGWLKSQLARLQPVLVFIDTLREAHNGDENDSTVMRNVVTGLVDACRPAAVVLVSHSRKDSMFSAMGGDDLMSDARGSSYVSGRMDCIIRLTPKSLTYKGRSAGNGTLTVEQEPETGLVIMDQEAAAYFSTLHRRVAELRLEDPKMSINAMAKTIAENDTKYKKVRAMSDDISSFLRAQAPTARRKG